MQIDKLEIKGFGKFNYETLELRNGLNVVFGYNEAGKTSIQWFIRAMLYGLKSRKTGRNGKDHPAKKYNPWNGNAYGGSLEYTLENGGHYRIERDFSDHSIKVFDGLFKDITDTFSVGRNKEVSFAETHLGLNEACFDKTVFIKQMEAKVDQDGSKELLNRLMNAGQTGLDDVSFQQAQQALKEALKQYVGTDKTSTRPMDQVVLRLAELNMLREKMAGQRERLDQVREAWKQEQAYYGLIEKRKNYFLRLKEIVDWKEKLEFFEKRKQEFVGIHKAVEVLEQEREGVVKQLDEHKKLKEQWEGFGLLADEHMDDIGVAYYQLTSGENKNQQMQLEIDQKKRELEALEESFGSLKVFGSMEQNIEKKVYQMSKEIDAFKVQIQKGQEALAQDRVDRYQRKNTGITVGMIASALVALLMLFSGGLSPSFFWMVPLSVATALALAAYKINIKRKIAKGLKEGEEPLGVDRTILNQLRQHQKAREEILNAVGASDVEDFILKKAAYDHKLQKVIHLNTEINLLESQMVSSEQKITTLRNQIYEKLVSSGVISMQADHRIQEVHIKEFKHGLSQYKELESGMHYVNRRNEELGDRLQQLYIKASDLGAGNFCSKEELRGLITQWDTELTVQYQQYEKDLEQEVQSSPIQEEPFDVKGLFERTAKEIREIIDDQYQKAVDQLNNIRIQMKEYETILENIPFENDEIQKVDEEKAGLEEKKNVLEGIGFSITKALEVLEEASLELQKDVVPVLNARMSRIIHQISGERYQELRADDSMSLRVRSPETGDIVDTSFLSGGTVDQVYLALRLSISEMLSSGSETLPLLMDEVFAQYDDTRTLQTMKYLEELSLSRQILLFTCKEREVEVAREVCRGVHLIKIGC